MRFQSYFNHALHIIDGFDGTMSLARFLKQYFSLNKKHGSTDRKMISHACYSYYRLGHALKDQPPAERLKAALFLCSDDLSQWGLLFEEEWRTEDLSESMGDTSGLTARLARVHELFPSFSIEDIFPWKEELSEDIDHHAFCRSFLRQPDLFLRIRPGHENEVLKRLDQKSPQDPTDPQTSHFPALPVYTFIPPFTLRLPNGFKAEEFFTPDKEIVVQDYSSQRLAPFLQLPGNYSSDPALIPPAPPSLWDACAASGGKSILAHDLNAGIELTVSDIRESILHNLDQRFHTAGIKNYYSFLADLSMPGPLRSRRSPVARPPSKSLVAPQAPAPQAAEQPPPGPFDLILADVPCSGSGTWSRTPEELYFFEPAKIGAYRQLQEKIVSRLVPSLGKKAYFVYSTCSVFKKENEEMAAFIRESFGLQPERMETINGVNEGADSMFAARFIS